MGATMVGRTGMSRNLLKGRSSACRVVQETDGSKTKDVFLYNKSHLRIGGELPPAELAKPLEAEGEFPTFGLEYSVCFSRSNTIPDAFWSVWKH